MLCLNLSPSKISTFQQLSWNRRILTVCFDLPYLYLHSGGYWKTCFEKEGVAGEEVMAQFQVEQTPSQLIRFGVLIYRCFYLFQ